MTKIFEHKKMRRYTPAPALDVEPDLAEQRKLARDLQEMIETDRKSRAERRREQRFAEACAGIESNQARLRGQRVGAVSVCGPFAVISFFDETGARISQSVFAALEEVPDAQAADELARELSARIDPHRPDVLLVAALRNAPATRRPNAICRSVRRLAQNSRLGFVNAQLEIAGKRDVLEWAFVVDDEVRKALSTKEGQS